jgi:hypothetical protein
MNMGAYVAFSQIGQFSASTPIVYLWPANHRRRFKSVVREKHLGDVMFHTIEIYNLF